MIIEPPLAGATQEIVVNVLRMEAVGRAGASGVCTEALLAPAMFVAVTMKL